jgi:CspA family cold shock protein
VGHSVLVLHGDDYWPNLQRRRSRPAPRRPRRVAPEGALRWFSQDKGYGFITPDDGSEDVSVRFSAIAGDGFMNPEEGEKVAYEASRDAKGPRATNVRKV